MLKLFVRVRRVLAALLLAFPHLAVAGQPPAPVQSVAGLTGAPTASQVKAALAITTADLSGILPLAQLPTIPTTKISGLAPSATTDTTNASNIASGTLGAAFLPMPTTGSLGGVRAVASVPHQWLSAISTSGVPALSQPAFSDLSGTATLSQLPTIPTSQISGLAPSATTDTTNAGNIASGTLASTLLPLPTVSTLGGVKAIAPVSHNWVASISTSGVPTLSQPSFADIGGTLSSSQVTAGLGFTPLSPGNNLSDVGSATTALSNLGGMSNTGSTATSAALGSLLSAAGTTAQTYGGALTLSGSGTALNITNNAAIGGALTVNGTLNLGPTGTSAANILFNGTGNAIMTLPSTTSLFRIQAPSGAGTIIDMEGPTSSYPYVNFYEQLRLSPPGNPGQYGLYSGVTYTGSSSNANYMNLLQATDGLAISSSGGSTVFAINDNISSSAAKGPKVAFQSDLAVTTATADTSAPGGNFVSAYALATANSNENGTDTTIANSRGLLYGLNVVGTLYSGATNWNSLITQENDTNTNSGASVAIRLNTQLVDLQKGIQGSFDDAALSINNGYAQTTGYGWKYGILFGRNGGTFPMDPVNGTMIGALTQSGTMLAKNGVDLSNVTFSAYSWNDGHIKMSGAGNLTVSGTATIAGALSAASISGATLTASGALQSSNNLSDVATPLTALANLGGTNAANMTTGTLAFARMPVGITSSSVPAGNYVLFNLNACTSCAGDGVTDDAAAVNAFLTSIASGGIGGTVIVPAGKVYYIGSANLSVPDSVGIQGACSANNPQKFYTLTGLCGFRINPSYEIILGNGSFLDNIFAYSSTLTANPTSAQAIAAVAAWGASNSVGAYIPQYSSAGGTIKNSVFAGFNTPIKATNGELNIYNNWIDGYNCIDISGAADNSYVDNNRCEPFYSLNTSATSGAWARPGVAFNIHTTSAGSTNTGLFLTRDFAFMWNNGIVLDGAGSTFLTDSGFEWQPTLGNGLVNGVGARWINHNAGTSMDDDYFGGFGSACVTDEGIGEVIMTHTQTGTCTSFYLGGQTGTPNTLTFSGTPAAGQTVSVTVNSSQVTGSPVTVGPYTVVSGDTTTTIPAALQQMMVHNQALAGAHFAPYQSANVLTLFAPASATVTFSDTITGSGLTSTTGTGTVQPGSYGQINFPNVVAASAPYFVFGDSAGTTSLWHLNNPFMGNSTVLPSNWISLPNASEPLQLRINGIPWSAGSGGSLASNCGASPVAHFNGGTDTNEQITLGGGTVTACTVTFQTPFPWAPWCVGNVYSGGSAIAVGTNYSTSATAVTYYFGANAAGGTLTTECRAPGAN